jgi:heme exporter protein C
VTAPATTGSRGSRILGGVTLALVVTWALLGLVLSPEDTEMGDLVRILYVHVPSATTMYLGVGAMAFGSVLWLWKRSTFGDLLAAAAAEITAILTGLCLLTGSLWGRHTWGTYWVWDARLTSTALMLLLVLGYIAVRRLPADTGPRNTRSAVVALLALANVPIVHFAVNWWRSIHQGSTISTVDVKIEGLQLLSLMTGFVAFLLLFAWLLLHRFRLAWLEEKVEARWVQDAIEERRRELGGEAMA